MLGYVAEWELQAISDRTKDGLRKARERGASWAIKAYQNPKKSKSLEVIWKKT